MNTKALTLLLLLGGCVAHWPQGSYNDLTKEPSVYAVAASVGECTANLVPPHTRVAVTPTTKDTIMESLPEALTRAGLEPADDGVAVTYVASLTNDGAFVRVTAPQGTCSQFLARNTEGNWQANGPVMVALK